MHLSQPEHFEYPCGGDKCMNNPCCEDKEVKNLSQPNFEHMHVVELGWNQGRIPLHTCSECSALVEADKIEGHREFHAKMDELIEWAQSVSKVIK